MEQKLYTLEELVRRTGESPETIKTKRKRGKLEYIKVPSVHGGRMLIQYTQAALDTLLGDRSTNNYETLRDEWAQAQKYGTHTGKPLKDNTVREALGFLKGYWTRLELEPSIQGISPANFEKVLFAIPIDEKKRQDHYSLRLKIYNTIASFYKHLIKRGFKNELELIEFRKLRPKQSFPERRTVLREGGLNTLLEKNESLKGRTEFDRAQMKILLLLYTCAGLRRNEALTLECDWIDFQTGEMRILGKDNKWRDLQAGSELLEQMCEWYQHWRPKSKYPNFILQKNGRPQTPDAVQHRMQRLRGNMDITMHGLRRTFATMAGESGLAPTKLQCIMGHKHLTTTERYLLTDGKAAAKDMAKIDFRIQASGLTTEEIKQKQQNPRRLIRDEWD
jgi:integrase